MIRKTPIPFFKTIGEIFQHENNLATIHYHFLMGKKIVFQNFPFTVKILNQRWLSSKFDVEGNGIKIRHNPFFLFNKKFCKVYYNSEIVIEISIQGIVDLSGYNLELNVLTDDKSIEQYCLACFIIYSIEYNLS